MIHKVKYYHISQLISPLCSRVYLTYKSTQKVNDYGK